VQNLKNTTRLQTGAKKIASFAAKQMSNKRVNFREIFKTKTNNKNEQIFHISLFPDIFRIHFCAKLAANPNG